MKSTLSPLQEKADHLSKICVVMLGFMVPTSTLLTQVVLFCLLVCWCLSGNLGAKIKMMLTHPVSLFILALLAVFFLGCFYGEATNKESQSALGKMAKLFYLPFLLPLMTEEKWRRRVFLAFFAAMLFTLVLAGAKMVFHLPIFLKYTAASIFKNHIDTNLMMAFAAFFVGHYAICDSEWKNRILGILLFAAMSFYILWMSEGRSGYVIFASLWLLFCWQRFSLKVFVIGVLVLALLGTSVMLGSSRFNQRLHSALLDLEQYQQGDTNTSFGARLEYLRESWALTTESRERLLFGFGTGTFKKVYQDHAEKYHLNSTTNPHNEYMNVLVQWGMVGLFLLLSLFFGMFFLSMELPLLERYLMQGLVVAIAVGSTANSWLMDFTPGYFFVVMAACGFGAWSTRKKQGKEFTISVIVTTYNRPDALKAVLIALNENEKHFKNFEIVIADDGSNQKTAELIREMSPKIKLPIQHVWQEDDGFRAATIRNKAILKTTGEYIIFLDGDCIPRTDFIKAHSELAESQFFVVGNRVLLNQKLTETALEKMLPLHQWSFFKWWVIRCQGLCNRSFSFLSIPLGPLRKLKQTSWQGAKTCNLAVWKSDLIKVNGFDESFSGWGYEDSDLVIRLIRAGIKRKEGRFRVPVIHLWHPENDRGREKSNWAMLQSRQQKQGFFSERGLTQYLGS